MATQRANHSLALYTDLYQLTMAQAYWQSDTTANATFSLFFRNLPPDRGYLVFCGLPDILEYIESFGFTPDDIRYLQSLGQFDDGFLDFLSSLRFSGDVFAMREGSVFFANEPVIEITAPVIEAQLLETYVVNQVNMQALFATKAARVMYAADGRTVVDFAARRTHGIDAGVKLARAGFIAGFAGTSNVTAGALFDIPTGGTLAHAFITSS